ncbi:conserved hypothetical protein [Neospora caninum Liverpool]|uniref:Alpha/beta hydrolase family protein n=1 Tax=Neospora caninum (strain Liverpool) TaxID=572307 RepID=F0VCH3_NEOCL|nr:conserved hypothetical protein [Neospora caninum Liverpool]CBZ51295.1 conserved hypothetical protein [Neospora caninum Liverpool]CEL68609.1 TPA: hypothetical protein BN1204_043610 [Neospora caninum Liverpool]|eukprot:XP_003881328.1 conserved hypothetical protein [Neospora caninum Liverpool]
MSQLVQKVVDSGMFPGTLSSYEVTSFPQLLLLPRLDSPETKIPLVLLLLHPRQHLRQHLATQLEILEHLRLHARNLERHYHLSLAELLRFRERLRARRRGVHTPESRAAEAGPRGGDSQAACPGETSNPRSRQATAANGDTSLGDGCLETVGASRRPEHSFPPRTLSRDSQRGDESGKSWSPAQSRAAGAGKDGALRALGGNRRGRAAVPATRESGAHSASGRREELSPEPPTQAGLSAADREGVPGGEREEASRKLPESAEARPCSEQTDAQVADLQRRLTHTRAFLTLLQRQFLFQQRVLERELQGKATEKDDHSLACSEVCVCGFCVVPGKRPEEPRDAAGRTREKPTTGEAPEGVLESDDGDAARNGPRMRSGSTLLSPNGPARAPRGSNHAPACASPGAVSNGVSALFSGPTAGAVASPYLIIYAHGNGSDIGDVYARSALLAERLRANFLLFDYPGYGKYAGAADEASVDATLRSVLAFATDHLRWPPQKIILWGTSIGTGPCTRAACSLAAAVPSPRPVGARGLVGPARGGASDPGHQEESAEGFSGIGTRRRRKKRSDVFCVGETNPRGAEEGSDLATETPGRVRGTKFASFFAGVAAAVASGGGAGLATTLGKWMAEDEAGCEAGEERDETEESFFRTDSCGDSRQPTLSSASLPPRCNSSLSPSAAPPSLSSSPSSLPSSSPPRATLAGFSSSASVVSAGSQSLPVASRLASLPVPAGLVLQCPYRSITHAAAAFVPSLVARALVASRWNVENEVLACDCPVLWIHGQADELFPWEGSLAMFDAYRKVCELRRARAAAAASAPRAAPGAQLATAAAGAPRVPGGSRRDRAAEAGPKPSQPGADPAEEEADRRRGRQPASCDRGDTTAHGAAGWGARGARPLGPDGGERGDLEERRQASSADETDPRLEAARVAALSAFARRDVEEWAVGHFPEKATHGDFDFRKDLVAPVQRLMRRSQQRCIEAFVGELLALWTAGLQSTSAASPAGDWAVVRDFFSCFWGTPDESPACHRGLAGVSASPPAGRSSSALASRGAAALAAFEDEGRGRLRLRFLLPPHFLCGLTLSHPLLRPFRPTVGDYFSLRALNSCRLGSAQPVTSLRGWFRGDVSLFGLGNHHVWGSRDEEDEDEEEDGSEDEHVSSTSIDESLVSSEEEGTEADEETEEEEADEEDEADEGRGGEEAGDRLEEGDAGGSELGARLTSFGSSALGAEPATETSGDVVERGGAARDRQPLPSTSLQSLAPSARVSPPSSSFPADSPASRSRQLSNPRGQAASSRSVSVSSRSSVSRPRWPVVVRALAARTEREKARRLRARRKRAFSAFSAPDLARTPKISLPPLQENLLQNFSSLPALLAFIAHRYALFLSCLLQVARERLAVSSRTPGAATDCFLADVEAFVRRLYGLLQPSLFVDAVYKNRNGVRRDREVRGGATGETGRQRSEVGHQTDEGARQGGAGRMQSEEKHNSEPCGERDVNTCYALDSLVIAGVRIRLSPPAEATPEDLSSSGLRLPGMLSSEYLPLRRPPPLEKAAQGFRPLTRAAWRRDRRGVAARLSADAPQRGGTGESGGPHGSQPRAAERWMRTEGAGRRRLHAGATARPCPRKSRYFSRPRLSPLHLLFPAPNFLVFPVFVPPLPSLRLTVQWLVDALALSEERSPAGVQSSRSTAASEALSVPAAPSLFRLRVQGPHSRGAETGRSAPGAWQPETHERAPARSRRNARGSSPRVSSREQEAAFLRERKKQISLLFADQLLKQLLVSPVRPAFEALGVAPVPGRLAPPSASALPSAGAEGEETRGFPVVVGARNDFIAGRNFFPFGWDVLFLLLCRSHIASYLPRLVPAPFLSSTPRPSARHTPREGVAPSSPVPRSSAPRGCPSRPVSSLLSSACVASQSRWGEDPETLFAGAQHAEQFAQRRALCRQRVSSAEFPRLSPDAVERMSLTAAQTRAASLASSLAFCLPLSLGWAFSASGEKAQFPGEKRRDHTGHAAPLGQKSRETRVFYWEELSPAHSLLVQAPQILALADALDLGRAAHAAFLSRATGRAQLKSEPKDPHPPREERVRSGAETSRETQEVPGARAGEACMHGPVPGGWRAGRRALWAFPATGLPPSVIRGVFLASERERVREERRNVERAAALGHEEGKPSEQGSTFSFFPFSAKGKEDDKRGTRADVQDIACPVRAEDAACEGTGPSARGDQGSERAGATESGRKPAEGTQESQMEKLIFAFFRDSFVFSEPKFFLEKHESARDAPFRLPDRILKALRGALRRHASGEAAAEESEGEGRHFSRPDAKSAECRRGGRPELPSDTAGNPSFDGKIRLDDVAAAFLHACREADLSGARRRRRRATTVSAGAAAGAAGTPETLESEREGGLGRPFPPCSAFTSSACSAPRVRSSSSSTAPSRETSGGEMGKARGAEDNEQETISQRDASSDRRRAGSFPCPCRRSSSCADATSSSPAVSARDTTLAPVALFLSGAGDCPRLDTERDEGDSRVSNNEQDEKEDEDERETIERETIAGKERETEREETDTDDGDLRVCEAPLRPFADSWDAISFPVSSPSEDQWLQSMSSLLPLETPTVQDEQRELAEWCLLAALIRAELATASLLHRATRLRPATGPAPRAERDRAIQEARGDRSEEAERGAHRSSAQGHTSACVSPEESEEELLRLALGASSVHGLAAAASPSLPFHPLTVALERLLLYALDQIYRFDSAPPSTRLLPSLPLAPYAAPLAPFLPVTPSKSPSVSPRPCQSPPVSCAPGRVAQSSATFSPVPGLPLLPSSPALAPGGPPSLMSSRLAAPLSSHASFPAHVSSQPFSLCSSSSLGSVDKLAVGRPGSHASLCLIPGEKKPGGAGGAVGETRGATEGFGAQQALGEHADPVFKNSAGTVSFRRPRGTADAGSGGSRSGVEGTRAAESSRGSEDRRFSSLPSESCERGETTELKGRRHTRPPIEIRNVLLEGPRPVGDVSPETKKDIQRGRGTPHLPPEVEETTGLGGGVSTLVSRAPQHLHALAHQSRLLAAAQEMHGPRMREIPAARLSVLKTSTPPRVLTLVSDVGSRQRNDGEATTGSPAPGGSQGVANIRQSAIPPSRSSTENCSLLIPVQAPQEVRGPSCLSLDDCTDIRPRRGHSLVCPRPSRPPRGGVRALQHAECPPEAEPGRKTETGDRLPTTDPARSPNGAPPAGGSVLLNRNHMRQFTGSVSSGPMRRLPPRRADPRPAPQESAASGDTGDSQSARRFSYESGARNPAGRDTTENNGSQQVVESALAGSVPSPDAALLRQASGSLSPAGRPRGAGVTLKPLATDVFRPRPGYAFPPPPVYGLRAESVQTDELAGRPAEIRECPGHRSELRHTGSVPGVVLSLHTDANTGAVPAACHQQERKRLHMHRALGRPPQQVEKLCFVRRDEFAVDSGEETYGGEERKLGQLGGVQNPGGEGRRDTSSSGGSEGAGPIFAVDNLLSG